jgi:NAD(P)-dependent dehydrogenase (short-subunit alcohol dehydrogenase family)
MQELAAKVAFISGGASGIGLGLAKVFAEEARMKVVIADIQQRRLDEAAAYFRDRNCDVHIMSLDITDRDAYARAADEVERIFGPVQMLMNNAGVSERVSIEEATYDDWDWHLNVNLQGVINGIQTFVPRMVALGKGGHIVNTGSIQSFFVVPTSGLYSTTKFAVRGLSEALRVDLEKFDIGVSCLCPGSVRTNILDPISTRPKQLSHTTFKGNHEGNPAYAKLRAGMEAGMDPVELARITLDGVRRNEAWIFPYPEFLDTIEQRNKEVADSMKRWLDHPDYHRRMKLRAELALSAAKS